VCRKCAAKRAGLAVRPLLEIAGYRPKQRVSAMSLGENRGDVRASAPVCRAAVADLIHTLAVDEDSGVLEQTSMALQILDAKEAIPVLKARLGQTIHLRRRACG